MLDLFMLEMLIIVQLLNIDNVRGGSSKSSSSSGSGSHSGSYESSLDSDSESSSGYNTKSSSSSSSSGSRSYRSYLDSDSGSSSGYNTKSSESSSSSGPGSHSGSYESYLDSESGSGSGSKLRTCQCGKKNKSGNGRNRIIGGSETKPHEYPWLVRIIMGSTGEGDCGGKCTGALISDRHIITAYHCIANLQKTPWKPCDHSDGTAQAYIGAHYVDGLSKNDATYIQTLKKFEFPPHAGKLDEKHTDHNDMAVYILDKPIRFSEKVYPICLPKRKRNYSGKKAIAAGWGGYRPGLHPNSKVLRSAQLEVTRDKSIYDAIFFTKTEKNKEGEWKDPCGGDSGGPLMYPDKINNKRYTLIGVVYGGGYNCNEDKIFDRGDLGPGPDDQMWSKVSNFLDWIENLLKEEDADMCAYDY